MTRAKMRERYRVSFTRLVLIGVLAVDAAACANIWNFQEFESAGQDASTDSTVGPATDVQQPDAIVGDDAAAERSPDDAGPMDTSTTPDVAADVRDARADGKDANGDSGDACTLTQCDGGCLDTTNDRFHCGSCTNVCTVANQTCVNSACVCTAGFHDCSGICLNSSNVQSCGTSCTPCVLPTNASSYGCSDAGACYAVCPNPQVLCNANTDAAACVSTTSDLNNCGGCGSVCKSPQGGTVACSGNPGACVVTCNAGLNGCPAAKPTACVDFTRDTRNCGGCGTVCPAPDGGAGSCVDGGCQ